MGWAMTDDPNAGQQPRPELYPGLYPHQPPAPQPLPAHEPPGQAGYLPYPVYQGYSPYAGYPAYPGYPEYPGYPAAGQPSGPPDEGPIGQVIGAFVGHVVGATLCLPFSVAGTIVSILAWKRCSSDPASARKLLTAAWILLVLSVLTLIGFGVAVVISAVNDATGSS